MLRPLPDLDNAQAMTKLGRLSALRSSRADALSQLRDAVVRLQNASSIDSVEIKTAQECLDRLREIDAMSSSVYGDSKNQLDYKCSSNEN